MDKHSETQTYNPRKRREDFDRNSTYSTDEQIQYDTEKSYREEEPQLDGNRRVVATHYNSIRETGKRQRMESRIFYMRNFNNWIKSMLINEYIKRIRSTQREGDRLNVLDMCCGKGGDLLKWSKANITHLVCTDIAEVSVEQCKTRYESMNGNARRDKYSHHFTAEFIACDSTLVRLRERYRDPSIKLNLVSCQFALHYSFESLSQADCMVRNAAECLEAGGYFIASIPDANEIMRRVRDSENERSFGNSIYNIEFMCETDPPPLFGAKYQFHLEDVVDCPEFLVYFPLLVKLCRKYGLQLERRTTFANYYRENASTGLQLLERMTGLQTIYPDRISPDDPEYKHLFNSPNGSRENGAVSTLSKSEWEAITIYLVCAFRKCKNTWDSDGQPVYQFEDKVKSNNGSALTNQK